jgi:hypothetical protein
LRHSPSVKTATDRFPPSQPVTSGALVGGILHLHPEYGHGLGAHAEIASDVGQSLPVQDWVRRVEGLFDPERVPALHGRLFILGLARLDTSLFQELSGIGLLDGVRRELREPFDDLLANRHDSGSGIARLIGDDRVAWQDDVAATEDRLVRKPFARYLGARLRYIHEEMRERGLPFARRRSLGCREDNGPGVPEMGAGKARPQKRGTRPLG